MKNHLGLTRGGTRVYDVVQQLAQPEDSILDRFQVDVIDLGRTFNTADSAANTADAAAAPAAATEDGNAEPAEKKAVEKKAPAKKPAAEKTDENSAEKPAAE